MRLAYIKTNNAVEELRRTGAKPADLPEGGPDAYVAHVLHVVGEDPALLLSIHLHGSESDMELEINNKIAYSYYGAATSKLGKFFRRVNLSIRMFSQMNRFRPSIILCAANSFPLWVGYLVSRVRNIPFIYSRHNRVVQKNEPLARRIIAAFDKWIIKKSRAVICHGPYLRQQMLDIGVNENLLFEYNWSFRHMQGQLSPFKDTLELNSDGTKKIVLFIGRMQGNKGIFDLYMSCIDILRRDGNFRLVYAGDGIDLDKLKQKIEHDGYVDQVHFLGMISHQALSKVIRQSVMVVTPTKSSFPEGRCMAAMEGMACGVPVIAPDFGPFPYLVKHRVNGLLFEPDSVDDLRVKIELLLNDQELYNTVKRGALTSAEAFKKDAIPYSQVVQQAIQTVTH